MKEENYVFQAKIDLVKIFENLTEEEKEEFINLIIKEINKKNFNTANINSNF